MEEQNGGAIVLVASVAGIRGLPGAFPYSVAKGALYQFARSLASELSRYNVRVNTVSPGIVRTSFHDSMTAEQKRYNLEHRIPLGREGQPSEIATAIHFLLKNEYITGQDITVDGGLTMRIR
jgi:NAD(P)-dependent dehydrogenase (short-subunit alcohol dehydrogenase family)